MIVAPFWFNVSSARPFQLSPRLSLVAIVPFHARHIWTCEPYKADARKDDKNQIQGQMDASVPGAAETWIARGLTCPYWGICGCAFRHSSA